ncbi:zinc finger and SCAN domain-containing protein 2 isoform X2 [Hydra vulgaris]|uniref:Zinc finger and SCAN domain-containing protein 2 isoform X2 n=1 Tax=Hydra vulgaris TaxID=6087 RepID=A0ABM4BJD8_HYDVU
MSLGIFPLIAELINCKTNQDSVVLYEVRWQTNWISEDVLIEQFPDGLSLIRDFHLKKEKVKAEFSDDFTPSMTSADNCVLLSLKDSEKHSDKAGDFEREPRETTKLSCSKNLSREKNELCDDVYFECQNCHMTFADNEYLSRHSTRCINHENADIRCNICKRGFTTKGSLDLHVKCVHFKEKEFQCSVCNKMFSRKHILNIHMATHVDSKDYKCTVCDKSFSQKSNLHRHSRIHTSTNYGYKCRFCGQTFTQNKHLQRHVTNSHAHGVTSDST